MLRQLVDALIAWMLLPLQHWAGHPNPFRVEFGFEMQVSVPGEQAIMPPFPYKYRKQSAYAGELQQPKLDCVIYQIQA